MHMPTLLNHTCAELRRFNPVALNVQTKLTPFSTATMTVQNWEPIALGDWVRIVTPQGDNQVYIVTKRQENILTGQVQVTMEHALGLLKDIIRKGEWNPKGEQKTARQAILHMLNGQKKEVWKLGDCEFTDTNPWTFKDVQSYAGINTVLSALEDAMIVTDCTVFPFLLHIRKRPTKAACEMRQNRNISTLSVSVDRSTMYNSIIATGESSSVKATVTDDESVSKYGLIEHTANNNQCKDSEHLRKWAKATLKRHKDPTVTATVSGFELSQMTGLPIDKLLVGTKCVIPLPDNGGAVEGIIDAVTFPDLVKSPQAVNVTISNNRQDTSIVAQMAQQAAKSGGHAAQEADVVEQLKSYITKVDGGLAIINQWEKDMGEEGASKMSKIVATYDSIQLAVNTARKGSAGQWMTDMASEIKQTASSVSMMVQKFGTDGKITSASITASIKDAVSKIEINADQIDINGLVSKLDSRTVKARSLQTSSLFLLRNGYMKQVFFKTISVDGSDITVLYVK